MYSITSLSTWNNNSDYLLTDLIGDCGTEPKVRASPNDYFHRHLFLISISNLAYKMWRNSKECPLPVPRSEVAFSNCLFCLTKKKSKPCDHLLTFWWSFLVSQHGSSCFELNSWLLPTSYLITDLPLRWRLCSVHQAQEPNLSHHVYWYCIDLKDTQRAAHYLICNTSCIVLNFAWSHWPGYSFIIHGDGRKATKWIHTHTHACMHI